MNKLLIILLAIKLVVPQFVNAQKPKKYDAAEIQLGIQKLKVLGSVLYVAAHPDDENTRLITYFANEVKLNTAYFSFTRGDGGQNLIGPEMREDLGVIRTQELLAARRIDHGQQFFSRAVDFGYSKHPDETFTIWNKGKVLGDLVWVIRKFRPDVIITRFNTIPGNNHGHHTASAILASEAFDMAGDPSKFSAQLIYVDPWQPKTLYWNTYWWRKSDYEKDTSELLGYDIGKYNALKGLSYSEIAALSRSSHRSQGFGATGTRGVQMEYLQFEKGQEAEDNIFEHIDLSWNKIEGGKQIDLDIDHILSVYDPVYPERILTSLIRLRKNIENINDVFWRKKKLDEVDEIIYGITGLFIELKAKDFTACPGESVDIEIEAINRSKVKIILKKVTFTSLGVGSGYAIELKNNALEQITTKITLPNAANYSQPYWLVNDHDIGMFEVDDQQLIGMGENEPAIVADIMLKIEGEEIVITKPVIYKRNDPVRGEVYRPFVIAPPVYANISERVVIFANHAAQEIKVVVKAGKTNINGTVSLNLPQSWKVEPANYQFELGQKGETSTLTFMVTPPENQETAIASATVEMDGEKYNYSFSEINYDHIPAQMLFYKNDVKFVKLDLKKGSEKIGYIVGAGDNIPKNLKQIGYEVTVINEEEYSEKKLDSYDVIILGVRALNTVDRLKFDMGKLLEFAHRGGTLILQYNTSHRLVTEKFAPYPMQLSRDRITVEEAPVTIVNENHLLMNFPNKITDADFEGWVQERGLYFPGSWSEDYDVILSSHDPDEKPLEGGLLVAKYGKGHFIYSGYSWFRELPAGIPGPYRIFVNMISIGNYPEKK